VQRRQDSGCSVSACYCCGGVLAQAEVSFIASRKDQRLAFLEPALTPYHKHEEVKADLFQEHMRRGEVTSYWRSLRKFGAPLNVEG
jgi:hypothetical protein